MVHLPTKTHTNTINVYISDNFVFFSLSLCTYWWYFRQKHFQFNVLTKKKKKRENYWVNFVSLLKVLIEACFSCLTKSCFPKSPFKDSFCSR